MHSARVYISKCQNSMQLQTLSINNFFNNLCMTPVFQLDLIGAILDCSIRVLISICFLGVGQAHVHPWLLHCHWLYCHHHHLVLATYMSLEYHLFTTDNLQLACECSSYSPKVLNMYIEFTLPEWHLEIL